MLVGIPAGLSTIMIGRSRQLSLTTKGLLIFGPVFDGLIAYYLFEWLEISGITLWVGSLSIAMISHVLLQPVLVPQRLVVWRLAKQNIIRRKRQAALLMAGLVFSAGVLYLIFDVNYESCDDEDNCLTIAFEVQDTYLIWDKNPQHLADKMSSLTGMDVEIYPVTGSGGIIEVIDKGNADIGFVDGAAA